ncbi:MAG TPA: hypothetical protein VGC29_07565 [Flavisolibacter sp.]
MNIVTTDYIIWFVYFVLAFAALSAFASKRYGKDVQTRKYFLLAFSIKAISAFLLGIIYQFYYGFGDTFGFHQMGLFFSRIIKESPDELLQVFISGDRDYYFGKSLEYGFYSWYAFNPATIVMARICAFLNFFSAGLYLPNSLFFSLISFSGIWKLYRVFTSLYPKLNKELAIFTLFVPSVFFWGSGIMKDTLSFAAIGWLTWAFFQLFIARKNYLIALLIGLLSIYLIYAIKPYIVAAYLPAVFAWVILSYRKKIRNVAIKQLLIPFFIASIVGAFFLISQFIAAEYQQFALEKISETAVITSQQINAYEAGSTYNLGEIEPGLAGIASKLFPAFIVAFYRPFFWEVNNPFSLLSAMESFLLLILTLYVLRKVGIKNFFLTIIRQPVILYCFTFAIIFGISVGIASGNFGTLVRYKIPAVPFYLIGLLLIYYFSTGKGFFRPKNQRVIRRKIMTVPPHYSANAR